MSDADDRRTFLSGLTKKELIDKLLKKPKTTTIATVLSGSNKFSKQAPKKPKKVSPGGGRSRRP